MGGAALSVVADEQEWVRRIRAGDVAVFETLFHTYYKPLANVALRYLGSRDDAEEVVQGVFCRLWENRAGWSVRTTLRGYLYALVRNASLDEVRHRRITARCEDDALRREGEFTPGLSAGASAPADARLLERDVSAALRGAVSALPSRTRHAYVLRRDHGLSRAEVAEAMGISVKSVEKLLSRAHAVLRETLKGYR